MQSQLLDKRILDTADICLKANKPKFLGFLSEEEAVLTERILKGIKVDYSLFGGYDEAGRVMLGCFPEWDEERNFPITPITITFRKSDCLSHRDFLGSLMGLGLKREAVGDILTEEGRSVIFLTVETADYVISQLEKVGRVGVVVQKGFSEPLPGAGKLADFAETVSSNRLDSVVSALANLSRGRAVEIIENGFVSVNSIVCEKITKSLSVGDIVSVRTKGKFIIDSFNDKTRKGRLILKFKKYV